MENLSSDCIFSKLLNDLNQIYIMNALSQKTLVFTLSARKIWFSVVPESMLKSSEIKMFINACD